MISIRARTVLEDVVFDHDAPSDGEEIGRCTLDALQRGVPLWITWPFRLDFPAGPDSAVPSVLDGIKHAVLEDDPGVELLRRVRARTRKPPQEGRPRQKTTTASTA